MRKFEQTLTIAGISISRDPNPHPPNTPKGIEVTLYRCSHKFIATSLFENPILDLSQIRLNKYKNNKKEITL